MASAPPPEQNPPLQKKEGNASETCYLARFNCNCITLLLFADGLYKAKPRLLYSQLCLTWFNICFLCSKLPYDVTTEQALTHAEVVNKLESSIQSLRAVTDKVLTSIFSSLNMVP